VYKAHANPSSHRASRLKLVEFIQPGREEPSVCGALWRHGREVHLLAPAPRRGKGSSLLGSVLGWLDTACFAPSDPWQVSRTCAEWHLRCSPFDGSDRSLRALGELIWACRRDRPRA